MRIGNIICCILAAACFLAGALMRFVYTAVRFTGFLLWCAAGALLLYTLLDCWSRKRKWVKWCKAAFLVLLAAGVLFFTLMEAWVVTGAKTNWDADAEAIVVFGAGVNGTEPSLSLETRLEAALYYAMEEPLNRPIVVTGAQGPKEEISEAACMAQWLIERGIAEERILLEEQAGTTEENVRFSRELLAARGIAEDTKVALVTSDYHLCRTAWLWGRGAVPVAACMPDRFWPLTLNYYVREAFAMAAALVF